MTKEEMIEIEKGWREMSAKEAIELIDERMCFGRGKWSEHHMPVKDTYWIAGEMAIKALRYEPCRDTVSRQAAIDCFWTKERYFRDALDVIKDIRQLPSAQPEVIRCKDCKYFELDHFEKADMFPFQIPLIVAHEVCMKWGNGCQSSVDGWCFMAERKTDE